MNQRGAVYLEFLIAFVPFFLLFMCTIQLAMLSTARLAVKHAAYRAVRAAITVIDDDPVFHNCKPRGVLSLGEADSNREQEDKRSELNQLIGNLGDTLTDEQKTRKGGPRVQIIRDAAYFPLAAMAPDPSYLLRMLPGIGWAVGDNLGKDSLHGAAIGKAPWLRFASGYYIYSKIATAITFPAQPGGEPRRGEIAYAADEPVTVRVRYLYPCAVPIARNVMCESMLERTGIPTDIEELPSLSSGWGALRSFVNDFDAQLAAFNELYRELQMAEWAHMQLPFFTNSSARFAVLAAEATLPNQGAPYKYWSELGGECKGD